MAKMIYYLKYKRSNISFGIYYIKIMDKDNFDKVVETIFFALINNGYTFYIP